VNKELQGSSENGGLCFQEYFQKFAYADPSMMGRSLYFAT
jgi:hypothetical protein